MPYRLLHKHKVGSLLIAELPVDPDTYVNVHYRKSNGHRGSIRVKCPMLAESRPLLVNHKPALVPVMNTLHSAHQHAINEQIQQLIATLPSGSNLHRLWPVCRSIIVGRPLQIKMPTGVEGERVYTLGTVTQLVLSGGTRLLPEPRKR